MQELNQQQLSPVKSDTKHKHLSPLEQELEQLSKAKQLINVQQNEYEYQDKSNEMSRVSIDIDHDESSEQDIIRTNAK